MEVLEMVKGLMKKDRVKFMLSWKIEEKDLLREELEGDVVGELEKSCEDKEKGEWFVDVDEVIVKVIRS